MAARSAIIAGIRAFFASRGFQEAETPTIVAHPGMEPHLDPFRTALARHDGATFDAGLVTSPEYSMKKLLAAGLPRIFEITRCYRNGEPWDGSHNPEFTMIEWYRANADYTAIMKDTEEMVAEVARKATGGTRISYGGKVIDLAPDWTRMTVAEAMDRYAGIDLEGGIDDHERFRAAVESKGCPTAPGDGFDDMFFRIFLRDVEPKLGTDRPLILHEYPRSMAALARLKPGDPRFAERFEAYCGGMELCNAFSELNDSDEQRQRLEEESALRRGLGRRDFGIDEQFLEAVGMMPPAAGIALGVDRLVMLLTDAPAIRDVLFFPAGDLFNQ
jgi:lysyl-tRNA synthetase class 2